MDGKVDGQEGGGPAVGAASAGKPGVTPPSEGTTPRPVSKDLDGVSLPEVLTWTSSGEIALITGETGVIRQLRSTAALGGGRDLIYDPWQSRAVVFEADLDDQSGEIASYAVDTAFVGGTSLAPRLHASWVDGDARLLPAPRGIVVFEQSYGERWKVLFNDGRTSASVAAPRAASAWITGSERSFAVHALTYGDDGPLDRRDADVPWDTILSPMTSELNVMSANIPPTTRLLRASARGGALLFDVVGSDVAVRIVKGPTAGPAALVPLGASGLRIEDAIAFDGGQVALLLISGDSRVLAVETNGAGALIHADTLSLPGDVRVEDRFFSHDLAALGHGHALAGTSAGVFSIRVDRGAAGVHLSFEPGFDGSSLRGPIAPLLPKPL